MATKKKKRVVPTDILRDTREKYGNDSRNITSARFAPSINHVAFAVVATDEEGTLLQKINCPSVYTSRFDKLMPALDVLSVFCVELCELPDSDLKEVRCIGLTVAGKEKSQKLKLSFKKQLKYDRTWTSETPDVWLVDTEGRPSNAIAPDVVQSAIEDIRIVLLEILETDAKPPKETFEQPGLFNQDKPKVAIAPGAPDLSETP